MVHLTSILKECLGDKNISNTYQKLKWSLKSEVSQCGTAESRLGWCDSGSWGQQ